MMKWGEDVRVFMLKFRITAYDLALLRDLFLVLHYANVRTHMVVRKRDAELFVEVNEADEDLVKTLKARGFIEIDEEAFKEYIKSVLQEAEVLKTTKVYLNNAIKHIFRPSVIAHRGLR